MQPWCSGESDNMEMPDIRTLVPHAGPMVLLDRVIAADDENLCAEVRIRADSLFCVAGEVGAWAGLEYMAQAIGAYAGYAARKRGEPDQAWLLIGNADVMNAAGRFTPSACCCAFMSSGCCKAKTVWLPLSVVSMTRLAKSPAPISTVFQPDGRCATGARYGMNRSS